MADINFDDDTDPTTDSDDEEREAIIEEVMRYLLRYKLGRHKREETRVQHKQRRALRRRRQR
jgi:hypothetical protein